MDVQVVELRCAENPRRMFAKLLVAEKAKIIEGNLLEFACRDCARDYGVDQVLHRFDMSGKLLETEVLR